MSKRVLIADDNETIRRLVRPEVQELAGFEVCATVANGIEAVEAAIALRPDVLIPDLLMPSLNGIHIAGVLKKTLPDAKIILFSLYLDAIGRKLITALGARVVSKTHGLRGLRRALQEIAGLKAREVDEGLYRVICDRAYDAFHLDLLTQQFRAPLTRCSLDLKYLWVNEWYANFLRRPVGKILGRSILDVVGKSAFDLLQGHFDRTLRGENVSYEAEVDYESAGRRRIAASYRPTFGPGGSTDGWLAYVEDITTQDSHDNPQSSLATIQE
jgi:CheY-like chemotaxis protein